MLEIKLNLIDLVLPLHLLIYLAACWVVVDMAMMFWIAEYKARVLSELREIARRR